MRKNFHISLPVRGHSANWMQQDFKGTRTMLMKVDNPSGTGEIPGIAEQLIERVCESDESALATLFDMFADRVYAIAVSIVHSSALAEEICSDVFMQVWMKADRFDPVRGSAKAWIFTMARSRSLDALRREARHRREQLHPETDVAAYTDDNAEQTFDQLETATVASAVRDSLHALNRGQRQVIRLAFFKGLSHQEIAERLGLPLGTVKSHCRRGLGRMRSVLSLFDPARR